MTEIDPQDLVRDYIAQWNTADTAERRAAIERLWSEDGTHCYAGTPAVTRHHYGEGEAWYVATALDQPGVDRVIRRILDRHDLLGPYADLPDVETATRVAPDGTRLLFVLNHAVEAAQLTAPAAATDLLTGKRIEEHDPFTLDPLGVAVLRLQPMVTTRAQDGGVPGT
ncbi:Beta-galactosidase C-terminal domain [Streptomyces cupreus]|uniref:Beta-galactosidase C-terminal domain n=1 Tax=Streptomyces cupreus TaxID=2759956 RepID=A0A7X1M8E4_9ACTN|nr:Beta-galactosidase C-terminal domain [Streptomyces cupreus]